MNQLTDQFSDLCQQLKDFQSEAKKQKAKDATRLKNVKQINEIAKRTTDSLSKKLNSMKGAEPSDRLVTLEILEREIAILSH